MRLFIAFPLPETIKTVLARHIETIKYCGLSANFTKPCNLHITVKFLGETKPEMVEGIRAAMEETGKNFSAVNVRLDEFGFFPDAQQPRVFFIAADNEINLKLIAQDLEARLEKSGFARKKRFKAHITLARLKNKEGVEKLAEKIKKLKPQDVFTIDRLVLFKSILSAQGPAYEEIFTQPLTGAMQ